MQNYPILIGDVEITVQYTDADAKRYGLTATPDAPSGPQNKIAKPRTKAASKPATAPAAAAQ